MSALRRDGVASGGLKPRGRVAQPRRSPGGAASGDTLRHLPAAAAVLLVACAGCGTRAPVWETLPGAPTALGLDASVALIDPGAQRALLLPVAADLTVAPVSVPIGRGFATAEVTPDGSRLLALSRGDVPRRKATDQAASLTVIGGGDAPALQALYPVGDPLSGLTIDPQGGFAVVYPSAADSAFVQNPNELTLVDLTRPPGGTNPLPLTLRSFGGSPQGFVFTPTLPLPGGPRRLLVALTDRDVGLIDLRDPGLGDITVGLSSSGQQLTPASIAVSPGTADLHVDSRLAIRIADDPSVILVDLLPVLPGQKAAHSFRPVPNVVFAGGIPSDLAFLQTDGGLRLGALVPSQQALTLIDPATGITSSVALGGAYDHISVVTELLGGAATTGDVALVWSTQEASIAFVALGGAVGKPYKAVERFPLAVPVAGVIDVPAPNQRLKVLVPVGGELFFVLDVVQRTASPIDASSSGTQVTVSPDGQRAWLVATGAANVAGLDLTTLHPQNLQLALPVASAFDVRRQDGGRALVAVHDEGAVGLTVLDGVSPSLETAVDYAGVLLGGLQ